MKTPVDVRSPNSRPRQAVPFGSAAPLNSSRNRRTDMWPNRSVAARPPADHGELPIAGTRYQPPTNSSRVPARGTPNQRRMPVWPSEYRPG